MVSLKLNWKFNEWCCPLTPSTVSFRYEIIEDAQNDATRSWDYRCCAILFTITSVIVAIGFVLYLALTKSSHPDVDETTSPRNESLWRQMLVIIPFEWELLGSFHRRFEVNSTKFVFAKFHGFWPDKHSHPLNLLFTLNDFINDRKRISYFHVWQRDRTASRRFYRRSNR